MTSFYKKLTSVVCGVMSADAMPAPAKKLQDDWYEALVLSTRAKLLRALVAMLPVEEAEEVIQETYFKLYQQAQSEVPENPTAYVYRLARNLAIDRLRNKQVADSFASSLRLQYEHLDSHDALHDDRKHEEEMALLLQAINTMSPICRQVFVLRKLHGKSHKEIAQDLEICVKTVENHLAKGMQHCLNSVKRSHLSAKSSAAKKLA